MTAATNISINSAAQTAKSIIITFNDVLLTATNSGPIAVARFVVDSLRKYELANTSTGSCRASLGSFCFGIFL